MLNFNNFTLKILLKIIISFLFNHIFLSVKTDSNLKIVFAASGIFSCL